MNEYSPGSAASEHLEAGSYESALAAVRSLRQSGVTDPFDTEDSRVQGGLAALEDWRQRRNLHMGGVGSSEKAEDIVRDARVFLDAGFEGHEIVRAAREKLQDEYAIAEREKDKEPVHIIAEALKVLEGGEMQELMENKLREAAVFVEQGKIRDAIGVLTLALFDPRFKRLPKAYLDEIVRKRDALKTRL